MHGKLWVYEQDTRTYLAEWMPKTFSRAETLEVLRRDAAAALTRGAGWWWYEFATHQRGARAREWFIDPEIQAFASHVKKLYDYTLSLPDRGPWRRRPPGNGRRRSARRGRGRMSPLGA